jgi:signal transduction histidine kinase
MLEPARKLPLIVKVSARIDVPRARALVLLVDDSPTQGQRAAQALEVAGFRVRRATNGREAMDEARRWHPDVIVSDVLMPIMDGFALCREVRRDEALKMVPLVLHTMTFVDPRDEEFGLGLGATRFMLKSTDPAPLVAEVRSVLEAGHMTNRAQTALDDERFLAGYSERMAAKLEEKVAELEDAYRLLEQQSLEKLRLAQLEIAQRTHAEEMIRQSEAQIQALNADLERRVVERTAQLESAVTELDAFSYSVSHDLRAPLRAVNGFSRILLEDHAADLPPAAGELLRTILNSAKRMGQLIDDLLALSRLGRAALRKQRILPAEVARDVLIELAPLYADRSVEIVIPELAACAADPALLHQVYVNLLSNALKFTSKRAVAHIEAGCRQTEGEVVYFVRDNGAGFDMRYADKLFGAFQRLHRAEDYDGTGVGLAIVQRIVHRHGGRIWAEAAPDQGATFSFTLAEGQYEASAPEKEHDGDKAA